MMQRGKRKLEHIKYALELGDGPQGTHFEDLRFLHNCLPEINPADIDLSVEILGKQLRLPFFIDAVTGSTDAVTEINRKLAQVAARTGIAMAVGSQYGSVRTGDGVESYAVVRKELPEGLVFANISALATAQEAQAAVDMLRADALEVHLNVAQELCMPEGDRNFAGLLDQMCNIKAKLSVPVIVKETGCGIAREQYELLLARGFTAFDCAGAGGTNFPAIEAKRAGVQLSADFASWGMPTCWSLLDGNILPEACLLIGSGGVRSGGDAARAFALGADAVSMTGSVLALVMRSGVDEAANYIEQVAAELKQYLLLLGCKRPCELRSVPLLITGVTKDYLACRGYDLQKLCQKRRSF